MDTTKSTPQSEEGLPHKENKPQLCSNCGQQLTTAEIMSKLMHVGTEDGSINCKVGKAYCQKCKDKSDENGTFVGGW